MQILTHNNQPHKSVQSSKLQEPKLIQLGKATSQKKNVKRCLSHNQQTQECPTTQFSSTNPFFYIHKAMHQSAPKTFTSNKTFESIITQIHQMKQICQKILTIDQQKTQQCQKTLIMDLQNLQTRRVNFDMKIDHQNNSSQQSIKQHIQIQKWKKGDCMHGQCQQINSVLKKALNRLKQLSSISQTLQTTLERQKQQKNIVLGQNSKLREQIANLDDMKCKAVMLLKAQIQSLKCSGQNRQKTQLQQCDLMIQVGRKPLQFKQNNIQEFNQPRQQQQVVIQKEMTESRLSHVVYL